MTDHSKNSILTFAAAARRVQQRLWVRKGMLWLQRTWPYALGGVVLLALLQLLGLDLHAGGLASAGLLLWLAGCFVWAWSRRPGGYEAYSFWDQQTQRQGAFANAWWFEQQSAPTPAQEQHISRQRALLPESIPGLSKEIPLPDIRWLVLLPILALALVFLPHGSRVTADPELSTDGKNLAVQEGQKLAARKLETDQMKGLTEEEKKEVEKLQQKVQETAESLQQEGAKTAREVLAELEKRAKDAEKLAGKLGAGENAWASEPMVAELRKQADTAELGDAVANKQAESTGKHAQDLADKLQDEKLTQETRDRLAESLRAVGKQAQPEDKERIVGQHVVKADQNLGQTLPQEAGKEFQALADKMKTLAQREKAREQLEKLAQQLRDSGTNIAGQNQQGMQQLAGSPAQQGQGGQPQSGQGQQASPMQALQNAPQMQPMQLPGMSNAPQGQGQQGQQGQMSMSSPVPGSGQTPQMALSPANGQPGSGQNGKPMLIAPIPGTLPGQQGAAAILGTMPGMGQGGQQAGNGTTPLGNSPTPKSAAGQSAIVNAQRNADGQSSVRSVEGQARPEQASRPGEQAALQSISAEENALDEAALPTARREQVRRYFTELRKRFEKSN